MKGRGSRAANRTFAATLLILFAIVPIQVLMAQPAPMVVNTLGGSNCSFAIYTDPQLSQSRCLPASYDFDYCNYESHLCFFRQKSGPGVIDSASGLWTWSSIPASAVGQSFTVQVYAVDAVNGASGAPVSLTISIFHTPPKITSGCHIVTTFTGQTSQLQMAVGPTECAPVTWEATQATGAGTCSFSIDATGMLSFSASEPGIYELRVAVTDSADSDWCIPPFIVHGGANCCVGTRGNADGRGIVDAADLALVVAYLTSSYVVLECYDAANANGVGIVDSGDLSALVSYLTGGGFVLPNCP